MRRYSHRELNPEDWYVTLTVTLNDDATFEYTHEMTSYGGYGVSKVSGTWTQAGEALTLHVLDTSFTSTIAVGEDLTGTVQNDELRLDRDRGWVLRLETA